MRYINLIIAAFKLRNAKKAYNKNRSMVMLARRMEAENELYTLKYPYGVW